MGTAALRQVLGSTGWNALVGTPESGPYRFVIAFRDDFERLEAGLAEIELEPPILSV